MYTGNIWLALPSARTPEQVNPKLKEWTARGYRTILFRDADQSAKPNPDADVIIFGEYEGYPKAANLLVKYILEYDQHARWIVLAGDDTFPDMNHTAQEIAAQCETHFNGTFGVLQVTGDRWGENEPWARRTHPTQPAYIDRICGSPWLGREFCQRIYQGNGPLWPEYTHCFGDEELQNVAVTLGVFWQRRDLQHFHDHWGREGDASKMPHFLADANSPEHWLKYQALFNSRKAAGFPGHEPLPSKQESIQC